MPKLRTPEQLLQMQQQSRQSHVDAAEKLKQADDIVKNPPAKKANNKPKKVLTPEQLEKQRQNREQYKSNPAGHIWQKKSIENNSRVEARLNKAIRKEQKQHDEFTDLIGFKATVIPDEKTARFVFEQIVLDGRDKPACPHCEQPTLVWKHETRDIYTCAACDSQFNIFTNTIFANSQLPFDVLLRFLFELIDRKDMTVEDASDKLNVSMKTAWRWLTLFRLVAFSQQGEEAEIPENSVSVVDFTYFIGLNSNRRDWEKLTKEEIYLYSLKVLTIKTKKGATRAIVVDGTDENTVKRIINELVGAGSTIHCDEAAAFNIIGDIELTDENGNVVLDENGQPKKKYTLIRANHSAGDHGQGDAESANAQFKKRWRHHNGCFEAQGLQGLLNFECFMQNNKSKTVAQMFYMALKNCAKFGKVELMKRKPKRRSIFVAMANEFNKAVKAGRNIAELRLPAAVRQLPAVAKIIAMANANSLAA